MKKVFKINASVCDARKVKEETLAAYDEIRINSAIVLVSPETRALLDKYQVSMNTAGVLETEEEVKLATFNGQHVLEPGSAIPEEKRYLLINGMLDVAPGCEELLKSYVGITVNGMVTCPKSMASLLSMAQINGKIETYPDGCIRLKKTALLDKTFPLRAREGAQYYASGRVVAMDKGIDFDALAAKGVTFVTPRLMVAESLCAKAAPLFDAETEIEVLPDDCAYVDDDAVLDEKLLRRYGEKLYINGDLTVNAESEKVLNAFTFLKVKGDLLATKAMAQAAAGLKAEYDDLEIVADRVLSDRGQVTVDKAMLEQGETLQIVDCGKVFMAADVPAELIREKLLKIVDCGTVTCTKEQRSAVEMIVEDVGDIREPGQEEETGGAQEDEEVRRVNSASYIL